MTIKCPNCGCEVELPQECYPDGQRFRCEACSTKLVWYNGLLFKMKATSPSRSKTLQNQNDISDVHSKRPLPKITSGNTTKFGCWWGGLTVRKKTCYTIGMFGVAVIVVLFLTSGRRVKDNNSNDALGIMRKVEAERIYGSNSVEYLEADLNFNRNFLGVQYKILMDQEKLADKIRETGLIIGGNQYSNGHLTFLAVADRYTGMTGFMRGDFTSFYYPTWIPQGLAESIWKFYEYDPDPVNRLNPTFHIRLKHPGIFRVLCQRSSLHFCFRRVSKAA